ncbi:hypothetical protein [Streptomyces coacervatus]|nr:hypothetical protein [Streptomyces coacervatus]
MKLSPDPNVTTFCELQALPTDPDALLAKIGDLPTHFGGWADKIEQEATPPAAETPRRTRAHPAIRRRRRSSPGCY